MLAVLGKSYSSLFLTLFISVVDGIYFFYEGKIFRDGGWVIGIQAPSNFCEILMNFKIC